MFQKVRHYCIKKSLNNMRKDVLQLFDECISLYFVLVENIQIYKDQKFTLPPKKKKLKKNRIGWELISKLLPLLH